MLGQADIHRMRRRVWCVWVLGIFLSSAASLHAQISQLEGRPVVRIDYVPDHRLDPADLAHIQTVKVGQPLHAADVSEAVDGFFGTGRFDDVVVEAEPSGNGVIVRFVTKPALFLGGVNVKGKIVQPPNQGQIASSAQFTLGAEFRESDMQTALQSLDRLMRSNGLYEATITPSFEHDEDAQQVFVTLTVKEGKRAKYEMPVIQGDTKLSDATILRATGWRIPLIHWWRQVTAARTRKGLSAIESKLESKDRLTAKVQLKKPDYDAEHRRVKPTSRLPPARKSRSKPSRPKFRKAS